MLPNSLRTLLRAAISSASHPRFAAVLRLSILVGVAACMADTAPTAVSPAVPPTASFASSATDSDNDARKAEHERLKAQRDSIRAEFKRVREESKEDWQREREDWENYKKSWSQYKKENKNAEVQFLRCQPQPFAGDAEIIGPNGGVLKIGPHSLVVPKGAVDREVLLVGTVPTSSLVQVKFGPHGQRFDVPAALTLSYEHCMRPPKYTYRIVYVDEGRVREFPPSQDDKTLKKVEAKIDHFSGYMIAY